MTIDPGELSVRIEIYRKVYPPADADGYSQPALTLLRRCRAKVTDANARELAQDNADFSAETLRFLVRSRPGLDRKMLLRYEGRDYEIDRVALLGAHGAYTAIFAKRSTMEVI